MQTPIVIKVSCCSMWLLCATQRIGHVTESVSTTKLCQHPWRYERGTHINAITSKTSKTLSFLLHNLKIGNEKTKRTKPSAVCGDSVGHKIRTRSRTGSNAVWQDRSWTVMDKHPASNHHGPPGMANTAILPESLAEVVYKFHHSLVSINSSYLPKPSSSRLS